MNVTCSSDYVSAVTNVSRVSTLDAEYEYEHFTAGARDQNSRDDCTQGLHVRIRDVLRRHYVFVELVQIDDISEHDSVLSIV